MDNCSTVRRYITLALDAGSPSAAMVSHIAGCSSCRGALLLLVESLLAAPSPADSSCADCAASLPGYLDIETEQGTASAIVAFPAAALHLWTCIDCAELYQLTRATLLAARSGALPPPPLLPERQPATIARFTLARAWLTIALALPDAQLGLARSPLDEEMVIFDAIEGSYAISISVRRADEEDWTVQATVKPPVRGWFSFGEPAALQRARFQHGIAMLEGISAGLLVSASGPDLLGQIEIDLQPSDEIV